MGTRFSVSIPAETAPVQFLGTIKKALEAAGFTFSMERNGTTIGRLQSRSPRQFWVYESALYTR